MSRGFGLLRVVSQGLSRPLLKTFAAVFPDATKADQLTAPKLRNSGMSYLWSFVRQHHLTVLNLDLKPIFLRSIFIACNLVLFSR